MKMTLAGSVVGILLGIISCTNPDTSTTQSVQADANVNSKNNSMKSFVSIVEIPTADFSRAVKFYNAILGVKVEVVEMEGIRMALFPDAGNGLSVQLIHGSDYKPSADGSLVYLNGGEDLQQIADKIVANGGKILLPKTEIGPEMGFYAIFVDTEGNKVGLHSYK